MELESLQGGNRIASGRMNKEQIYLSQKFDEQEVVDEPFQLLVQNHEWKRHMENH